MPSKPKNKIEWRKGNCIGMVHCEWMCLQDESGRTPIACDPCAILPPRRSSYSENDPVIAITINGKSVLCHPGEHLIDVIRGAGFSVPTLCRHPLLPPSGACRLCLVEVSVDGHNRIVTSCDYALSGSIEVKTDTARILHHRRVILGMLLSEAPDAPRIQFLAQEAGLLPDPASTDSGPKSHRVLTQRKSPNCVLCGRCVGVCQSITHCDVLEMCGRASKLRPARAFDADDDLSCTKCGACAAVCPTGALKIPPSFTSSVSVPCTLCALICPDAAVSRDSVTGEIEIDADRCKSCGLCIHYCPSKALRSNISCDR